MEQASEFLRKKGLAAAAKKAGRIATEGAISSYIHNGRVGVLLEVNCETDFVAKTEDFQRFIKDVAMHIAGAHPAPLVVAETDMDPAAVEKEREIRIEAAKNPKQVPGEKLKVIPEAMIPKVVEGQIAKWKKDVCLIDQVWVRDPEGRRPSARCSTRSSRSSARTSRSAASSAGSSARASRRRRTTSPPKSPSKPVCSTRPPRAIKS